MLTGLRPGITRIRSLKGHFRDSIPGITTLPQFFREKGYFTARAGKIFHMGVPDAIAVRGDGKDDSLSWDYTYNAPGYELNANGEYYNATPWETHRVGTGGAISWLKAEKGDRIHHDYNVASEIIRLMKENRSGNFFLAAGFIRPHVPWVAPKRFFQIYDSIIIDLPFEPDNDRKDMPENAWKSWASDFNLSETDRKNAIRAYYATVTFMDEQIGRLLKAIEEHEIEKETIVVLASDHGFQLGEHGLWFKNFLFRESVISPLIIYDPEIEKRVPSRFEAVELLDVYPTIVDLAGFDIPEFCQGLSLKTLMESENSEGKNYAVVESHKGDIHGYGLYTRDWAFMKWEDGNELYNLGTDQYQFTNLAGKEEYSDIEKRLNSRLASILEK
jgi:uncharacterized sulfatase